jgi:hypothetical protein
MRSPIKILVSNVVAELCLGKGLPFRDLGDISLKGFSRPIRVHAVEWPGCNVAAAMYSFPRRVD